MLGYVWIDRETVLGNNVKNCADDTEVRDKQEKQFASPPSPDSQGIDNTEFVASRMVQFNSISSTVAHLRSDLVISGAASIAKVAAKFQLKDDDDTFGAGLILTRFA